MSWIKELFEEKGWLGIPLYAYGLLIASGILFGISGIAQGFNPFVDDNPLNDLGFNWGTYDNYTIKEISQSNSRPVSMMAEWLGFEAYYNPGELLFVINNTIYNMDCWNIYVERIPGSYRYSDCCKFGTLKEWPMDGTPAGKLKQEYIEVISEDECYVEAIEKYRAAWGYE